MENTKDAPQVSEVIELKPSPFEFVKMPPASEKDKARTFIFLMNHRDAPKAFNVKVLARLKEWQLIDDSDIPAEAPTHEQMIDILYKAREATEKGGPGFRKAFAIHPWNFDESVEAVYTPAELQEKFPRALSLQQVIQEPLTFIFRSEPGEFYLRIIERANGARQVLRVIESERDIEAINQDAQKAPSIIPRFEAVRFADGKTGLLIEWVEGKLPSTIEEEMLCLSKAEELLQVPIDSYDLWAGNFLVSNTFDLITHQPVPYYIDRDIPETIATKGYAPEVTEQRKTLLEEGKTKMK